MLRAPCLLVLAVTVARRCVAAEGLYGFYQPKGGPTPRCGTDGGFLFDKLKSWPGAPREAVSIESHPFSDLPCPGLSCSC